MRGRRDAKDNHRDYGIARNFGPGLRDWKTVLGSRWIGLSPIHTNPNTFETVYFFIRFGLRLHTKPVNPLTDTKRESFSLADTAYFWNRSSERIFWIRRFWWICVDDGNRDIFEVHYACRFGLQMPTREKIANVNSSVDCWIQINPIHHTEFVPAQVKLTALYGSCFCSWWETHVDVALGP